MHTLSLLQQLRWNRSRVGARRRRANTNAAATAAHHHRRRIIIIITRARRRIHGADSGRSQRVGDAVDFVADLATLGGLGDDGGVSSKVLTQGRGHEGDALSEGACVAGERAGVALVEEVEEAGVRGHGGEGLELLLDAALVAIRVDDAEEHVGGFLVGAVGPVGDALGEGDEGLVVGELPDEESGVGGSEVDHHRPESLRGTEPGRDLRLLLLLSLITTTTTSRIIIIIVIGR